MSTINNDTTGYMRPATPPTEQATEGGHVPQDLRDVLIQAMRDCAIHSLYQHKIDHILKAIAPFCRAPAPAVAQGETQGKSRAELDVGFAEFRRELNAAKADVLRGIQRDAARLVEDTARAGELATLRQSIARLTEERDQARQDLEERCAENDRERAAHLQAYQAVTRERDEARAELPKEAFASNVAILELQSKLTAAESELAELRKDRERVHLLEVNAAEVRVEWDDGEAPIPPEWSIIVRGTGCIGRGASLRAAIDAARQSSSTHQQGEGA